jgi:hypothetical protein
MSGFSGTDCGEATSSFDFAGRSLYSEEDLRVAARRGPAWLTKGKHSPVAKFAVAMLVREESRRGSEIGSRAFRA